VASSGPLILYIFIYKQIGMNTSLILY